MTAALVVDLPMLDRNELFSLVICPVCGGELASWSRCARCATSFSESDGTPVLIAGDASRAVSFRFDQSRSTGGNRFQECFDFPPRCGAAGRGRPYHLDLAHADIFEELPLGSMVMELGCGGGQMRSYLESRSLRYIGTDISKTRVHEHLQRHGGPDLLCDCHFLPFVDGTFDVVYSTAVTQHLACPHLVAQEAARVLKPGGYYLGNVAFLEPWTDSSFYHMTPLGVFEMLTQAGFDIVYIWPGQGYSGYRAMLAMGNRFTRPLVFLGETLHFIYRSGNRLRDIVRGRGNGHVIADAARVAGATDWIARRPHVV